MRCAAFIPNDLSVNDWRVKIISNALLSSLSFSFSRVKLSFLIFFNAFLDKFGVALKNVWVVAFCVATGVSVAREAVGSPARLVLS